MNSKNSYLNSLTDEVDGLEARFDSTKQLLNNFEKEIENLEMNIKYRKASAALEDIQSRVETKRNQMAQISGDLSSEQMRKRIESMREEFEKEMRQLSELNGQLSAQQARALEIQSILQQSKESKLQLEHRTANVKLSTSEIALEDLDKYYNAMDKALMAFHSRKMEEINSVLRDLWQTTYKNKDIDFIAIRSDFADQMSRKQYSYRVVMSKEGREMTMKGRCSAGQRVLACILIRMAIAETFCLKCGVLALDEPTTNLDARNIRALAESLNEIITRRREQHGFQLIVITHDEEFVSNLRARDHTDYVYHVSKNENHYSKISRKSLR
jgi:DNA repair protein RAD50